MYKTITENSFIDEFRYAGRGDNFSREGLIALFNFFNEMEEETNEKIELDVVAICCDFTEFDDLDDLQRHYPDVEELDDFPSFYRELDNGHILIQDF